MTLSMHAARISSLLITLFLFLDPTRTWANEQSSVELGTAEAEFPADLRFLNHRPAGALGRVRAVGDGLEFGDGTPARFWGVNVQANALFRSKDKDISYHAERLARMGVNLVRLHHHDSHWVQPNIFGKKSARTTNLDSASLRKIDLWVSSLRAQGVYIWLDLHVGRRLTVQDTGAGLSEVYSGKHEGDLRGYNYVNDDIKALMQTFTAQYLTHVNPFTGLAYKDDPAIAAVLVTNENDLTKHFAHRLLPDKKAPFHAARYMDLARDFAKAQGLPARQVWRGWEFGPAKIFLAELEHRFYTDMTSHLRKLGYDGLIAVSNFWGGMPLAGLPALTAGDLIDVHSYSDTGDIARDPEQESDIVSNIAAAHVTGMPLSVSEWNIAQFRSADRLFAPFRMASMAAFQGWDAMMLYGYAQRPLRSKLRMGAWHGATDPSLVATLPAAALLYRQEHVPVASNHYVLRPTPDELFGRKLDASSVPALRQIPEQAGLSVALPATPQLPWLISRSTPAGSEDILDIEQKFRAAFDLPSGTVPFRRDPQKGIFTIETGRTQLVAGHLAKQSITLSGIEASLKHDKGMIAVQSLGKLDLAHSDQVLISVALPSYPKKGRRFPFQSAPLSGKVVFDGLDGLKITSISPAAADGAISHRLVGKRHEITFRNAPGAMWVVLTR